MTGAVVWITGLPSCGKSTFARRLHAALLEQNVSSCVLDGDAVRAALRPEPGYTEEARRNFYASLSNLAVLLADQGLVVLVPATASRAEYRAEARRKAPRYFEVYLEVPASECARRDSKGLYQAVRDGQAQGLPGGDAAYEVPEAPDVVADGGKDEVALHALVERLDRRA